MEPNTLKRTLSVQMNWRKRPRLMDSDSGSESVYNVQQHDLVANAVKNSDTSDSDMTEFEVGRLSPDVPNPFFSTDDSDEINEINEIAELGAVVAAVSANLSDIDVGQLADTSTEPSTSPTSNSDADPELPRLDYLDFWTCAQCKAVNENRHVPFCSACYTLRKTFFPPRPRRRRLQRPQRVGSMDKKESVLFKTSSISESHLIVVGGGTDSGVSSQDTDVVDGPIRSSASLASSSEGSKSNADSDVTTKQEVDVIDGPSATQSNETCQICLARQADGLFKHGKTTHRYCCYSCAKATWRRLGHCPLCRRKIDCVLKLL